MNIIMVYEMNSAVKMLVVTNCNSKIMKVILSHARNSPRKYVKIAPDRANAQVQFDRHKLSY